MKKVINFSKSVMSWFYDRTPLWIILGFFFLMTWGLVKKNDIAINVQQEDLNCKLECMPNASELFSNQCWCYYDNKTLVKSDQRK